MNNHNYYHYHHFLSFMQNGEEKLGTDNLSASGDDSDCSLTEDEDCEGHLNVHT